MELSTCDIIDKLDVNLGVGAWDVESRIAVGDWHILRSNSGELLNVACCQNCQGCDQHPGFSCH